MPRETFFKVKKKPMDLWKLLDLMQKQMKKIRVQPESKKDWNEFQKTFQKLLYAADCITKLSFYSAVSSEMLHTICRPSFRPCHGDLPSVPGMPGCTITLETSKSEGEGNQTKTKRSR